MPEESSTLTQTSERSRAVQLDRRVAKTRKAIMQAFYTLLDEKKYNDITIQDIINEADIGRSTFYAHFETKDELLHTMCAELFEHVFSGGFKGAAAHDIPEGTDPLAFRIYHIFEHLYDNKKEIVRIMRFDSSEIYKQYLRGFLEDLFKDRVNEVCSDAPKDFVMKQLTDSFISALEWWAGEGMKTGPGEFAGYYVKYIV